MRAESLRRPGLQIAGGDQFVQQIDAAGTEDFLEKAPTHRRVVRHR
jgi:hypothetical protein